MTLIAANERWTWRRVYETAGILRHNWSARYDVPELVHAIPTGGSCALPALLQAEFTGVTLVAQPDPTWAVGRRKTLVFDDVADTGKTLAPFLAAGYRCAVLVASRQFHEQHPEVVIGYVKSDMEYISFPWETRNDGSQAIGPEDAVRRILASLGYDPDSEHLRETPRRVLSWFEQFRANREPDFTGTTFDGITYDGMVVVRDVPFVSLCEHHLLPFTGSATVGYIPGSHTVVGLSKLARVVQHVSQRLQVQECMTTEITDALLDLTGSRDVAAVVSAEHLCMSYRGPRVSGAKTVTSSMLGKFMDDPTVRSEFLDLAR